MSVAIGLGSRIGGTGGPRMRVTKIAWTSPSRACADAQCTSICTANSSCPKPPAVSCLWGKGIHAGGSVGQRRRYPFSPLGRSFCPHPNPLPEAEEVCGRGLNGYRRCCTVLYPYAVVGRFTTANAPPGRRPSRRAKKPIQRSCAKRAKLGLGVPEVLATPVIRASGN